MGLIICQSAIAQESDSTNTKKRRRLFNKKEQNDSTAAPKKTVAATIDSLRSDTTNYIETVPLDIAQDRGLFISSSDKKMQMRILGSVRYLAVFDNINLSDKNNFSTFEIPVGDANQFLPNFYNGLDQTRLGFEVTREAKTTDIFIRLETDFAGSNGFRIRHAYGQTKRFILGQTWSLFSQLDALPAIVNFANPTGSVIVRNPQFRYSPVRLLPRGGEIAFSLEYVIPDLNIPDSLALESFQLLPYIGTRIKKSYKWGNLQLSGILPLITVVDEEENLIIKVGWGISGGLVLNSWQNGKWYFQGAIGQGISNFFPDLAGNGVNILFNDGEAKFPLEVGFYGTYEHYWTQKIYSNITYGAIRLENISFAPEDTYRYGHTVSLNTFYNVVSGARLGVEGIWGERVNLSDLTGESFRINILAYYDF